MMTGEAHWIPIVLVLIGGLSIVALVLSSSFWGGYLHSEERHLICPSTGKEVTCTPVMDTRMEVWTGVQSCSAFRNPYDVRCSKDCLKYLETKPADLIRAEAS